ncbi:MAG: PIN/TRAM domain-containing protein [Planctomycetia bacterium]|nr:PIN/TRAM domain-containing protein [Planctomycetia bacterium]
MSLIVLRCIFVMVTVGIGASVVNAEASPDIGPWLGWMVLGGFVGVAVVVIIGDVLIRRKELDVISSVYFGTIVGLFLAYVVGLALAHLPIDPGQRATINLMLGVVLCYVCISLLMQTRNDFRFIIPYVEFAKEVKGLKPFILDTSVVIDGRIADVVETGIFDSQLIMPRFVLAELQNIADSADRLRRSRGRRGLDVLNKLRGSANVDFQMYDRDLPEFANQPVDLKLVLLAKHLDGKIVTNDYNLNKVAQVQGVEVINLNDLANALKPVFLPGEHLDVRIVKPGEEAGQGVGYLDDGTMIVVESGREHLNKTVKIAVTSVLQTSAGRMIFGRYEAPAKAAS